MSWLKQFLSYFGTTAASGHAPVPTQAPPSNDLPKWPKFPGDPSAMVPTSAKSRTSAQLANDANYLSALTRDGFSAGTDADIAFLKRALRGIDWPKGITLRKCGTQLGKDELRALGYRSNLVITQECLEILTDAGKVDPVWATQSIVSALGSLDVNDRKTARHIDMFGSETMIQVYANKMLAGPCPSCTALASKPVPLSMAPSGPLPDCPHPDQCVLHWRTHLTFD